MSSTIRNWHLITGEYPPDCGGVADYTVLVANGLAQSGRMVHVWTRGESNEVPQESPGFWVHRVAGLFGWAGLVRMNRAMNQLPEPRTLCIQYVPHAYGWKAMNILFIAWVVWRRLFTSDRIVVMFHEVVFPWVRRPLHHNIIAVMTRLMAGVLARAAHHSLLSIPAWEPFVRRCSLQRKSPITTLAIPSTIPKIDDPAAVTAMREQLLPNTARNRYLVGHFGTYGSLIVELLKPTLRNLLQSRDDVTILLLGMSSAKFKQELTRDEPQWAERIIATGELTSTQVSQHLQACDLVFQPYPDGASYRRTSLMAALANGVPVVTTTGKLSEPLWSQGSVVAVPVEESPQLLGKITNLLDDFNARTQYGQAGLRLYQQTFSLDRTVAYLNGMFDSSVVR